MRSLFRGFKRVPGARWSSTAGPPPEAQLQMLTLGAFQAQALSTAAQLKFPEAIEAGPLTAEELASRLGLHSNSVFRLLRFMSTYGVFRQDADGKWHQTPLSAALRNDRAGGLVQHLMRQCAPGWSGLHRSLATGGTGFGPDVYDGLPDIWAWLKKYPEQGALFNATMETLSAERLPGITGGFNWGKFDRVIDVGGGKGHMLAAILRAYPSIKQGVVFDLPEVIDAQGGAKEYISTVGLSDRVQLVGGSFFDDGTMPEAGPDGAITMKWIIHDWSDEKAQAILQNAARSLRGGKLLIIDAVHPEEGGHPFLSWADIHMMAVASGKERTATEWRQLLGNSGLQLDATHALQPLEYALTIIECSAK